jgi:hypothetical protein
VEDFGAAAKGMKGRDRHADHLNKPDVGSNIANTWFDVDKVDVIVDVPNSGVGLAVNEVARQKNKLFLAVGPATSDLTGPKCGPNTIAWIHDTWALRTWPARQRACATVGPPRGRPSGLAVVPRSQSRVAGMVKSISFEQSIPSIAMSNHGTKSYSVWCVKSTR